MEKPVADYESELVKNGVIAFVPSGNSMWPTLKNKGQSVIVVKKQGRLCPMDVALHKREGGTNVLHRVMSQTDDGYIMCGDSQFVFEHVNEGQVYGVMKGFYRGKKYVDAADAEYIEKVKKLFANEKRRKARVKAYFFSCRLKSLPARAWRKLFGKKKKEGDADD